MPLTAGLHTGVKTFLMNKVKCVFCFEICTPEGRGGDKGENDTFKKSTQNLCL